MWYSTLQKSSKLALLFLCLASCVYGQKKSPQPVYVDKPFWQDYSVKYYTKDNPLLLKSVAADRNGSIKIFSSA